jgi:uncharacterized protein
LMLAAEVGNAEGVVALIEAGVDLSAIDKHSHTALMRAASARQTDVVELLISEGVDPAWENTIGESSATCAVVVDCVDTLKVLYAHDQNLLTKPPSENQLGHTLVMRAAEHNSLMALNYLLAHTEIDLSAVDGDGYNALMLAASRGYMDVLEVLLNAGADIDVQHAETGKTALMLAAQEGHEGTQDILRDWGANALLRNSQAMDAAAHARSYRRSESSDDGVA